MQSETSTNSSPSDSGQLLRLMKGDCLERLRDLPDNSLDSCVTDPPYGLKFMSKKWDHDVPSVELWREVFRVLKPGAHLLSFFGTRTYHRGVVAIEDAGFEIRDQIGWLYGSGFPKSLDVSKAIDKAAGAEREVTGSKLGRPGYADTENTGRMLPQSPGQRDGYLDITAPATEAAKQWDGWGTALKPAHEPVVIGYKPLTVEQFIAILVESVRGLLCQYLPVSDAARSSIDIPARPSEVASSVPENARTYELARSGNVSFAAARFTCQRHESGEPRRTPESSAHASAKGDGCLKTSLEIETLLGRVDDFLSRLMATSTSDATDDTSVSTALLWNEISDDLLSHASTFTTSTGIRLTTALRTLSFWMYQSISGDTGSSSPSISPGWQSIVVARKPLIGTVAQNVLEHGTGGLNIDGCRVGPNPGYSYPNGPGGNTFSVNSAPDGSRADPVESTKGRWPANVIHDGSDEVLAEFAGEQHRFFYCSKANKKERNAGLEDLPAKTAGECTDRKDGSDGLKSPRAGAGRTSGSRNAHPTVKPLALMEYLVKLVTPPGGTVLDPFLGSGTTMVAAAKLGFDCIGMEREPDYWEIIGARVRHAKGEVAHKK